MNIRLVTQHAILAESVARSLREHGHEVDVQHDTVFDSEIRYSRATPLADVTLLVEQLKPLLPLVHPTDEENTEVEVRLGESKPFGKWEINFHVESEALGDRLRSRLLALGFREDGLNIEEPDRNLIKYGGATPFARQVVRWLLAEEGITAAEHKEWGDDDNDIWVYARDPNFEGKTVKERYPIEIYGDDYKCMFLLKERIEAAGFAQVSVRSLDDASRPKFGLGGGPFSKEPAAVAELAEILGAFLTEHDVDADKYPLAEFSDGETKGHARIDLPIGLLTQGQLRPYAGAYPDRWEVILRTDEPGAVADLKAMLTDNGYRHITVEPLPSAAFGFTVRWGAAKGEDEVGDFIRGVLAGLLDDHGLAETYTLNVSDALDDDDPRIIIELPLSVAGRLSIEERLGEAAKSWELSLKGPRPDDFTELQEALKVLPWKEWATETESDTTPRIRYGGAPVQLVEHVRGIVEAHIGVFLPLSKDWGDSDDDIWIHLPGTAQPEDAKETEENQPLDLSAWLSMGIEPHAEPRPLITVSADRVQIGPVSLPRRDGSDRNLVPRPEQFAHYCLDKRTAETLVHVAESVVLREPCLLEGETSVSKTSIVQYVAMLCDQPLVRLNLNGQTDTGELIGRFVPQDSAAALPVDPSELMAAAELLESESRMVLQRAADEGRTLTRVEVQQIMANERMMVHPWRWQDGLIVTAMKRGWWVVLDELNLAEPQILERLNPVLERFPSLVLTEHDNSVIGPGGIPVHPSFRMFATMNPAEYAGRSAISPAYRDRWRAYRFVLAPGEAEYLAMLQFLVHGQQPQAHVQGQAWLGTAQAPPMGSLADLEGIDDFLRALARFHAAIEEAVGRKGPTRGGQLGARRRDRYVFSRRGLLAIMDYLASVLATDGSVLSMRRALARYYLDRVQPGSDQRIVARLLDAAGIGPGTWAPERLDQLSEAPHATENDVDDVDDDDDDDDSYDDDDSHDDDETDSEE